MGEIWECKLGVLVIIECRDGVEKYFQYIADADEDTEEEADSKNEETNGDDQGDIDQ